MERPDSRTAQDLPAALLQSKVDIPSGLFGHLLRWSFHSVFCITFRKPSRGSFGVIHCTAIRRLRAKGMRARIRRGSVQPL